MWTRRLRYWLTSTKREAALRAEMEQHIEEQAAELMESGWHESAAQAEAQRRFGNFGSKQEDSREVWIARYWSEFWQDVRFGARTLIAQLGFALPALLTLVLGIGINTTLFNVYNGLALAPWAIRDAGQVVQVYSERKAGSWIGFSWPNFRYLRENATSFEGLAAFSGSDVRVNRGDAVWNADVSATSGNYFDLIGTGFTMGRGFSAEADNLRDPAAEIVLHHETWMTRFGGDPSVLGEWISLNGHRLQIVGVAASGFNGPSLQTTDMWIPRAWRDIFNPDQKSLENPNSCCVNVVGRLKPDVSRSTAQAELNTLSNQFLASMKREKRRVALTAPTFLANPSRKSGVRATLLVMGVASLLILLLACANVANLQLARAMARRREIGVRLSLGAGRGRILRQLLAEALLLSSLAGLISISISSWTARWAASLLFGQEERIAIRFSNDVRVLAFILVATLFAAVISGLAPALHSVREGTSGGLQSGARATSGGRLRSALLAIQVALCAILLSGAALLVRALDNVRHPDTGFHYGNVVVMSPGLEAGGLTEDHARGLLSPLVERIRVMPGVESVAWANVIPYKDGFGVQVADPRTGEGIGFGFNEVSANYFDVLRIPLLSGRSFTSADEARKDAVIVNEAAARRLWPGESPLGKTIRILPTLRAERKDLMRPLEVIGVVRNFGARGFGSEDEPHACLASSGTRRARLLIRYSGNPGPLMSELPKQAREIDQRLLASAATYSETIARAFRSAEISAGVAGMLGLLSLMLACVGIYGVAAYNVSQRTRELGVRMALGAHPKSILAMVLKQNLFTVMIGAAAGIVGALGFARLLTSWLYGVKPGDPLALMAASAILLVTSTLATWGPARRATRVDPAITLRHE